MRPSLSLITDHRPSRRSRSERRPASPAPARSRRDAAVQDLPPRQAEQAVALQPDPVAQLEPDLAVQRAREAGGPTDEASYNCHCGCVFAASVSTTVSCPHCGAGQAW